MVTEHADSQNPPAALTLPARLVGEFLGHMVPASQLERSGMANTPSRFAKAFAELTSGYEKDPAAILATTFESDGYDEIVVVRGIAFTSLCEHHLLPFTGSASVAYLPGKRVVGLSKIPRLVDCFARRLQVQERMSVEIADAIEKHLETRGVAVVVRGEHSCMKLRGAKSTGEMVTSVTRGVFRDDAKARDEVMGFLR